MSGSNDLNVAFCSLPFNEIQEQPQPSRVDPGV